MYHLIEEIWIKGKDNKFHNLSEYFEINENGEIVLNKVGGINGKVDRLEVQQLIVQSASGVGGGGGGNVRYVWWVKPCNITSDVSGKCVPGWIQTGGVTYVSLCGLLKSEGGYIDGRKSDGTPYTCNDVVSYKWNFFLDNTNGLTDSDGDGLKEASILEYDNSYMKGSAEVFIIYSKTNEMVESGIGTDFSVPEEVDKWKCYNEWDSSMSNPGGGGGECQYIQDNKPLWENGVMKIYNDITGYSADVKICFDFGRTVTIEKVVFDYKICNWVGLNVGTENDHVDVDYVRDGCKGWVRNKEIELKEWYGNYLRGRYFCFWLWDWGFSSKYTVYIDNVRLYIKP